MKKFILKGYLLLSILFLGVLIGVFQTDRMETEQGFWTAAFTSLETPDKEIDRLKEEGEKDLQEKAEEMTEAEDMNIFSAAGQTLSDITSAIAAFLIKG